MKKRTLLFSFALAAVTMTFAQRSPEHPLDIKDANFDKLADFFDAWEVGGQPDGVSKIDDEFYISRQRPLERIVDGDYQVRSDVDPNRKLCMWVPLDDPTSKWKALPRYCFEGDNFSMWQYTDIHGNWTSPWLRATAGITDVAHKNGVKVGCVLSVPWAVRLSIGGSDNNSRTFTKLMEKNSDGTFKHSLKLVKLMKYYGIDGIGCNSEFYASSPFMPTWQAFIQDCHKKAEEIGWHFQLHWYDGTNDYGSISFDQGLGNHNQKQFGEKGKEVTDMLFFNYNWSSGAFSSSVTKAESMGRSSYDLYGGIDIQGRAFNTSWSLLTNNKISIGLWGAHSQSLLHQSATDDGTSDYAIQNAYQRKLELSFSGGNRNPGLLPGIASTSLGNADLLRFHGLARFLSAKSTIQTVPFVTRFNLGNGQKFRNEGKVAFDHKWYNLNTQDYMPTWRWWITDANDQVTSADLKNFVQADLTFDDAYWGGSCLKLHGATTFSRVKLFKTMLEVQPSYTISLTYKMPLDTKTNAKLFVALKDKVTEYKEIAIPDAEKVGEWTTFTTTLDKLGLKAGDKIAMLGIVTENTAKTYEMLVGELAVRNPAQTFSTVQPTIKELEIIRGRYNALDFKMRYASKEESGEQKTYNDEVGTWYYEIYFQQKNHDVQLLTATTSWAAYVIDAPMVSGGESREGRFGVRAVSPDGQQGSEITWTEYQEIPYNQPLSDAVIDRQVIKPGETFKVSIEDDLVKSAKEWKIIDPLTGNVVAQAQDKPYLETKIDKVGLYDLEVTNSEGETTLTRGKIQISPEETGAVPVVNDITTDKAEAKVGENVNYTYTSRDGEGKVSRAIEIADPKMLMIPADVQKGYAYSYALWFKVNNYAHDKQGTNLISKNSIYDSWPHNNWGDLWVQIRPEYKTHPANEISFNTMGWTEHDNPNESMMSTGYQVTPGVWNHLVITQDEGKVQKMYFNGKKVAQTVFPNSSRREDTGKGDGRIQWRKPANIFIGGGGVYKAAFNGWVDEVQVWNKALTDEEVLKAMKGYAENEVPEGLQAYYTFETLNTSDSTYTNLGKLGADYPAYMVTAQATGGEDTSAAYYQKEGTNNDILGYPGIVGTLDVTTAHKWNVAPGAINEENGKVATVTYTYDGTYGASLTLTNRWGEDTKTIENLVKIGNGSGIGSVDAENSFSVYPNPFVESVNFQFAEAGDYTVNIVGTNGSLVQSNNIKANAGQVVNVTLNGNKGMYIVQVLKDGKAYKAVKVIKK